MLDVAAAAAVGVADAAGVDLCVELPCVLAVDVNIVVDDVD